MAWLVYSTYIINAGLLCLGIYIAYKKLERQILLAVIMLLIGILYRVLLPFISARIVENSMGNGGRFPSFDLILLQAGEQIFYILSAGFLLRFLVKK